MYNKKAVEDLGEVRAVVESFGASIRFRKLYGILNAIEMQVEEDPCSIEVVRYLGKASGETAVMYQVDKKSRAKLERTFEIFIRKLDKA